MAAEKNLQTLIQNMAPVLNEGNFVFCVVDDVENVPRNNVLFEFKETEGITLVLEQSIADKYKLKYDFISAWITLNVHSSLEAVGLTAAFSTALAENNISCNVVAGYYHDHIFVPIDDSEKTVEVLHKLSQT